MECIGFGYSSILDATRGGQIRQATPLAARTPAMTKGMAELGQAAENGGRRRDNFLSGKRRPRLEGVAPSTAAQCDYRALLGEMIAAKVYD